MSVFLEESGHQGEVRVDRQFLVQELGVEAVGVESSVPLIVGLIHHLTAMKNERQSEEGSVDYDEVDGSALVLHDDSGKMIKQQL
jgi:hypothetical protein